MMVVTILNNVRQYLFPHFMIIMMMKMILLRSYCISLIQNLKFTAENWWRSGQATTYFLRHHLISNNKIFILHFFRLRSSQNPVDL